VTERYWSISRGVPEPPGDLVEVSAGPARLFLDGGDVRYYSVGGIEVLRRIYVAVRNVAWETLPVVVSAAELHEEAGGGMRASYEARVADGEIAFAWQGVISLAVTGELSYAMTGTASSSFDYARVGLNILHPPSLEGRRYRAVTDHGVLDDAFPAGIGPQPLIDGEYLPLLPAFRALEVTLADRFEVRFELSGDEFETEDQRNWLDASYKTYSTPMSLGIRHAEAGDWIAQDVRVAVTAPAAAGVAARPGRQPVSLVLEEAGTGGVCPEIGLGLPADGGALGAVERAVLAGLGLGHLRADIRLSSDTVADVVAGAEAAARDCGCGLELAAFADTMSPAELRRLADAVKTLRVPLRRVLAFGEHEIVTSPALVARMREAVGSAAPVFGGTNLYFAELNRDRPDPSSADGFSFSANPQVHASDDRSLTETPGSFLDMLQSGRRFLGDRPIVVSPVTLLPRFNADAPGAGTLGLAEPPADARQASLICASFTALSAKFLAAGGATAVTMFEAVGDRGVVTWSADGTARTRLGELEVPPGAAFPVCHVLSVWGRWSGRPLARVLSSEPLSVDGAACLAGDRVEVLVANATARMQQVRLEAPWLGPAAAGSVRRLDAASVEAGWSAGGTRSGFSDPEQIQGGKLAFELSPYGLALVELTAR
jgi:D-apionolactonase